MSRLFYLPTKNKIAYPDYTEQLKIIDGVGEYTITEDGFVQSYGYSNGTAVNKPVIYLKINGHTVSANHGFNETWIAQYGDLFAVKKGDVVSIETCTWSMTNCVYFYRLRN